MEKHMPRHLLVMFFMISPLLAQQFTKVTSSPVVSDGGDSRSVNWIDYDNDNDLDLFITNGPSGGQNNFFYENDNGVFIKVENIAIALDNTGSDEEGIRACVSFVQREQFGELEKRLKLFNEYFKGSFV